MSTSKKILLIEDEKPISKALKHKLSAENFEVTVTHNGQEGLDKFEEESFDLVITDLMMPEMDGFQLLENISKKRNSGVCSF